MAPKKNDQGLYPSYSWPGGYPLYYFTDEEEVVCPSCINKHDSPPIAVEVNYADSRLCCGHCDTRIESAYGEDND